jgi:Putative DNA-binding domain
MKRSTIYPQEFIDAYNQDEKLFDIGTLKNTIEQAYGETDFLDFKEKLIKEDQIAKIIIAMANAGGGTVVFGIDDNKKPVGIQDEEIKDPTDFHKKLSAYLSPNLLYHWQGISYKDDETYGDFSGKTFFVCHIPKQDRYIPFIAKKSSNDINNRVIYIRKNTSTDTADNEDLEKMFRNRIIEQYEDLTNIDLEEHLQQLKKLYDATYRRRGVSVLEHFPEIGGSLLIKKDNKFYPKETYEEFIANMIDKKKRRIEIVLEVADFD